MWVVFIGHDKVLLTEYNNTRYAFFKDIPVEISPEVYNTIVLSRHINASEVIPCEAPVTEKPKETIVEKTKEKIKEIVKHKGKKGKR